MYVVPIETYERYKDEVLRKSLAFQEFDGTYAVRPLSDREIAAELGLTEETVREIRSIAEIDSLPFSAWYDADKVKHARSNVRPGQAKS